ncbi:MAG: SAM-dependent methyltransferase [Candidatus Micrarchaeia archaeon]
MALKDRRFYCKSPDGNITYSTDGNFLFAEKEGVIMRLDLFAGHYYKLRPYNGAVILEIDGLRMQLVRDFETPLDYSREVVKSLGISRSGDHSVLDTCMGLGYTAIAAAAVPSVKLVVTCEISDAVVTLAQWNPFSDRVFEKDSKIMLLRGSVVEHARSFESGMFAYVIHDPPRISHAPELYSTDFYRELYRILKKGGTLFHYVGAVGKGRGRRIESDVGKRLSEAGFARIRYLERLQGIIASKS